MRCLWLAWIVTVLNSFCLAGANSSAQVGFTLDFPGANPSHYAIQVSNDGQGEYTSNGQMTRDSEPADPAPLRFLLSDRVRTQIFDLVRRAQYFSGKVDSGRKGIANTGTKKLSYKDSDHNVDVTYNYSPVASVQQLTAIFQGLSTTLEFGRRLQFFHKYQKLALDEDLKRIEELQKEDSLGDVQAIAPVLKAIADDSSVMNVTRARALRLLNAGGK